MKRGALRIEPQLEIPISSNEPVEVQLEAATASGDRKASKRRRSKGEFANAYMGKLVKLVPVEVLVLFPAGNSLALDSSIKGWWALFCLLFCIIIRCIFTSNSSTGKGPQWIGVAISAISFVLWIHSLGQGLPFYKFDPQDPNTKSVISLACLAWSAIVPLFYDGSSD